MALLGNMNVFNKIPGQSIGGQSLAGDRPQSNKSGSKRNMFSGDYNLGFNQKSQTPLGYNPPYCYTIALRSGGMATFRTITGSGEITLGRLVGGVNITAGITGSGNITNAAGSLIVSGLATIIGTGAVNGSLIGIATATATLAGQGNITAALGALGNLTAAIIGTGTITTSITATGYMTADIGGEGDAVTPASVAAAVWEAVASAYNSPGTMGNKLNSAGGAADPWGTSLPGTYSSGTAGYILGTLSGSTYAQAQLILKILRNKTVTDPDTGIMTVYEDDGATVLYTGAIFSDVAGTQTYSGGGINRRDRLA
jgi:hypothetical protein